jgi:hypothetical protein
MLVVRGLALMWRGSRQILQKSMRFQMASTRWKWLAASFVWFAFWDQVASARWLREDEAPAHYEDIRTLIHVNRDSSIEETEEYRAVIDKREAIKDFSLIQLVYDANTTQMKVLSAKAVVAGQVYMADPKLIDDRAITQQNTGYDSYHAIRVALPQIAVGTSIELKVWHKEIPHPFPGYFSETMSLAENYPVRQRRLTLEGDIPFNYQVHDPFHELKVAEQRVKRGSKVQIDSMHTIFHSLTEEPFAAFTEPQAPTLFLSSSQSWPDFGNRIAAEYEKVLSEPLPGELATIADAASKKTDSMEKVELVLSELQKLIHYLGTWQTVGGQYFPKPLVETVRARYGDCKDYATTSVAILRKLGFDAIPVWTTIAPPGTENIQLPQGHLVEYKPPLPGLFFNHSIVKVKIDGVDHWIDPTSPVPYVRGTLPNLSGSYALTLRPRASQLEIIPYATAAENPIEATNYLTINADKTVDRLTRSKLGGFVHALMEAQESAP